MNKSVGKVLIIDDDRYNNDIVYEHLNLLGYKIKIIIDASKYKTEFFKYAPNIILVDLFTKNFNGIEFLKWVRTKSNIPIIIMSKNTSLFDKVLALDVGADDYILKPFYVEELVARIKAITRRYNLENNKKDTISLSDIIIDLDKYEVNFKGNIIKLPPKEFELLIFFINNPNKLFTRKELLDEIWGTDYTKDYRTIDVHIKRLREKFEPNEQYKIVTLWRKGYKFEINN